MKIIQNTALLALLIAVSGFAFATPASASEFRFDLNIGRPRVVVQQPTVSRRWVPERVETRHEQILVSPERHERQWVQPRWEVSYNRIGDRVNVLRPGYWTEVCIPARYETRCVQTVVPGYWEEVPCLPEGTCGTGAVTQTYEPRYTREAPDRSGGYVRFGYNSGRSGNNDRRR